MTHLETLVRILPRQRRTLAAARRSGTWQMLLGYVLVTGTAVLNADNGYAGWALAGLICGASLILIGGFRTATADLAYHSATALEQDVILALEEERERSVARVTMRRLPDELSAEITRVIRQDAIRKDHRRG